MARLIRSTLISFVVLALSAPVMAAQITIPFDEPGFTQAVTGCDHFRVYYCFGTGCAPKKPLGQVAASADNCNQENRQLGPFPLTIPQEFVDDQACFRVTVVNDDRNESLGDTFCVTIQEGV